MALIIRPSLPQHFPRQPGENGRADSVAVSQSLDAPPAVPVGVRGAVALVSVVVLLVEVGIAVRVVLLIGGVPEGALLLAVLVLTELLFGVRLSGGVDADRLVLRA